MPAKRKQASLKRTKSTTTYQRGGAKKPSKWIGTLDLSKAGTGRPSGKGVSKVGVAAKKAAKVKKAAGLKKSTLGKKWIGTLDLSKPNKKMQAGGDPTPTMNDIRTDKFINALDNVDRGLDRVFPGREGRQRNRAIKRNARQDATIDRSMNRRRDVSPEALPTVPGGVPPVPPPHEGVHDNRQKGGLPGMFRSAAKAATDGGRGGYNPTGTYVEGINQELGEGQGRDFEYGKGGVIKGSALRNNSRGKARKNR